MGQGRRGKRDGEGYSSVSKCPIPSPFVATSSGLDNNCMLHCLFLTLSSSSSSSSSAPQPPVIVLLGYMNICSLHINLYTFFSIFFMRLRCQNSSRIPVLEIFCQSFGSQSRVQATTTTKIGIRTNAL